MAKGTNETKDLLIRKRPKRKKARKGKKRGR